MTEITIELRDDQVNCIDDIIKSGRDHSPESIITRALDQYLAKITEIKVSSSKIPPEMLEHMGLNKFERF